jgi:hypothetical protein
MRFWAVPLFILVVVVPTIWACIRGDNEASR